MQGDRWATNDTQALTIIIESNHIDLAIAGWLDAHSRSQKTLKLYVNLRTELLVIKALVAKDKED